MRILSKAARLILIQTVMSAISNCTMQLIKLPVGLLDELDRLSRKFFWGEEEDQRKIHPISWEIICKAKDN